MSREQLAMRILASEAEVDSHRLRLGLFAAAEEQRIIDTIGQLSDLPVYIDDTPYQSMTEMRSKARRLSLEHGLDLLVVDYLQLVQGQGRGYSANRVQEISEISRSLKAMARDLNIALIACSQLSRLVENRPGHRPQLSDLRDSGSIEQDADVVMFIHREDVYTTEEEWEQQRPGQPYPRNIADIIVAKHRNGPTGNLQLEFRDNLVRFDSFARAPNTNPRPPTALFPQIYDNSPLPTPKPHPYTGPITLNTGLIILSLSKDASPKPPPAAK